MTDTLTQRVAFEKWADDEGLPIERFNHRPDMYKDRTTHLCWAAVEAAIEASGAKHIPALVEALKFYANNVSTEKYIVANKVLAALPPELRGEG